VIRANELRRCDATEPSECLDVRRLIHRAQPSNGFDRKILLQLQLAPVLLKEMGLRDVVRGKTVRTTMPWSRLCMSAAASQAAVSSVTPTADRTMGEATVRRGRDQASCGPRPAAWIGTPAQTAAQPGKPGSAEE
jgi:hypothetical protein